MSDEEILAWAQEQTKLIDGALDEDIEIVMAPLIVKRLRKRAKAAHIQGRHIYAEGIEFAINEIAIMFKSVGNE